MSASLLNELDEVQNDLPKKARQRYAPIQLERERDVDMDKLYGPLDGAIAYLQEMREKPPEGATLGEKWTGYEDMYHRFEWESEETPEEFEWRLRSELHRHKAARADRQEKARVKGLQTQIEKLQKEIRDGK